MRQVEMEKDNEGGGGRSDREKRQSVLCKIFHSSGRPQKCVERWKEREHALCEILLLPCTMTNNL